MGDIREGLYKLGLECHAGTLEREEMSVAHLPELTGEDIKLWLCPLAFQRTHPRYVLT